MTITAFPLQAAGLTFGQEPMYSLLDHLISAGVVSGLAVTQRAAGANMSVDVGAGAAYVAVASGGKRQFLVSATSNSGAGTPGAEWTATFATAHATLPRIDRVAAMVQDNLFDSSTQYRGMLRVVQGTASSGATLTNLTGAPALPANCIHLAYVLVPAAATSITTANISSTTRSSVFVGGGTAKVLGAQVPGGFQKVTAGATPAAGGTIASITVDGDSNAAPMKLTAHVSAMASNTAIGLFDGATQVQTIQAPGSGAFYEFVVPAFSGSKTFSIRTSSAVAFTAATTNPVTLRATWAPGYLTS